MNIKEDIIKKYTCCSSKDKKNGNIICISDLQEFLSGLLCG